MGKSIRSLNRSSPQIGFHIEEELFAKQAEVEAEALELYNQDPAKAEAFLTEYSVGLANKMAEQWWKLGDQLWVSFNNRF